jgi:iron complex outermembrane receptor protein
VGVTAGRGDVTDTAGNPARQRFIGASYLQGDLHYSLNDSNDLALSYSHTVNVNRDQYKYMSPGPYYLANIDFSGNEYVDRITLQQSTRQNASLRTVFGGELSREEVDSPSSFDQFGQVTSNFQRIFGSAEWRMSDDWLLNAGGLAEHSNLGGDSFSPRVMVNWHFLPGHTLRLGASSAFRPPSAYEKYSQVQYYDVNGANPTGYYVYNNGSVNSEKLISNELGYFYASDDARTNADVRVFSERITDGIASTDTQIVGVQPYQYVNSENYQIKGLEWQLNWMPRNATKVFFSQTWTQISVDSSISSTYLFRTIHSAPRYADSLTVMHTLDSGLQVSLLYQRAEDVALMSISTNPWLFSMERTDLRFSQPFRISHYHAELALTLQNIGAPYQDGDWKFYFDQRAMLTLRLEE